MSFQIILMNSRRLCLRWTTGPLGFDARSETIQFAVEVFLADLLHDTLCLAHHHFATCHKSIQIPSKEL